MSAYKGRGNLPLHLTSTLNNYQSILHHFFLILITNYPKTSTS